MVKHLSKCFQVLRRKAKRSSWRHGQTDMAIWRNFEILKFWKTWKLGVPLLQQHGSPILFNGAVKRRGCRKTSKLWASLSRTISLYWTIYIASSRCAGGWEIIMIRPCWSDMSKGSVGHWHWNNNWLILFPWKCSWNSKTASSKDKFTHVPLRFKVDW